jgi:hypothetical protein
MHIIPPISAGSYWCRNISLTMVSILRLVFSCFSALLVLGSAFAAQVTLPYGTFVGVDNYISDSGVALPTPLIAYLNIPYAAPPIGQRRFDYPQPPLKTNRTISSIEYGPICPQPGTALMDEDCLSLAVFAPNGTTKSDKLPVAIWSACDLWYHIHILNQASA